MTAPGEDTYADWDGAYVLGALTPADRLRYERHLAGCAACREAVAGLAGLPGLLGTVPPDQLPTGPVPDGPRHGAGTGGAAGAGAADLPADLLPRLLAAGTGRTAAARPSPRGPRSGGRPLPRRWAAASAAAALLAAAVVAAVLVVTRGPAVVTRPALPAASSLRLAQVVPSPLTADVTLVPHPWGTQLDVRCGYAGAAGSAPGRGYVLVVVDTAGADSPAASWTAGPGSTVEPVGSTAVPVERIHSVEIRGTTGVVLLRATR